MTLTNPTLQEIDAAVAEKVARLPVEIAEYFHDHPALGRCMIGGSGPGIRYPDDGMGGGFSRCTPYSTSADAVLPLLEEMAEWKCERLAYAPAGQHCCVTVWPRMTQTSGADRYFAHSSASFPLSASIALLRARGVEVVFIA